MPNGDPRDRIFYPTLTLMIDFFIIHRFSSYKVNKITVVQLFETNLQKVLEKGKSKQVLLWQEPVPTDSQMKSCVIITTKATHFSNQPTSLTSTIWTPPSKHSTLEQRQIYVDASRRCMCTGLKQYTFEHDFTLEVNGRMNKVC